VVVIPVPTVFTPPGVLVSVQDPDGSPLNETLPVATEQVGATIAPMIGVDGTFGGANITMLPEACDSHPNELVTVNVNVPSGKFVIVVLVPDPVTITAPGDLVILQLPVIGKPFSTTDPVGAPQAGWVTVPTTGAFGLGG
jgi:hypothetical protein